MKDNATRKIFIVDDDLFTLEIYKGHLQDIGFESVSCYSAPVELIENLSQNPDLIFLDYCMSEYNGFELLKIINEYNPQINVVIVSGQSDMHVTIELLNNGAFDYIMKGEGEIKKITTVINKWLAADQYREKMGSFTMNLENDKVLKVILEAKESVRKEIANELHDNISQLLANSKLYVETALLNKDCQDTLLGESCSYIDMAINEVRKLSHSLNTNLIRDIQLEEELGAIIDGLKNQHQFQVKGRISFLQSENLLGNEVKHAIIRVVQEHLNNVMKHARASEVIIDISLIENSLNIHIGDNGKGFNPLVTKKGLGINNIKDRITEINGEVLLTSSPGQGCTLDIQVPVKG